MSKACNYFYAENIQCRKCGGNKFSVFAIAPLIEIKCCGCSERETIGYLDRDEDVKNIMWRHTTEYPTIE